MRILRNSWSAVLLAVLPMAIGGETTAQKKTAKPLDPAIILQLDELFGLSDATTPKAVTTRDGIWRACAVKHGAFDGLFTNLKARLSNKPVRALELRILRAHAHFLRRLGDLSDARRVLNRIQIEEETVADTLSKAEVLDALGSNDAAIAAYDRLLKKKLAPELHNRILLRKALMAGTKKVASNGSAGRSAARPTSIARRAAPLRVAGSLRRIPGPPRGTAGKPDTATEPERSALARFASQKGLARDLKNQAAIILALTNQQKDAIQIYQPEGEGTPRFRQEVRLAEWAIEAAEYQAAQEHAWIAVRNAKLKRDRRYSLSILVEAYRRTHQLDDLIAKFKSTADLDVESREVWIDLLRERGMVEESLTLFRTAREGQFTVDMRRELLEICREADDETTLENAYKKLIAAEPRFLEWREGLARFYLERGKRDTALDVWRTYLTVTKDNRYRMAAAGTLMSLGLDDLAIHFARECMKAKGSNPANALLFLFELHSDRGRHQNAIEALEELDRLVAPGAGIRKEIADAYARLGDKSKSVAILQKLYKTLGDETTPDTRMKLALMLSEIGDEDQALEHWTSLLRRIASVPRRRYVEERLMTVAARLGKLAKIAVNLEKKLIAGTADDLDAGLLVRLYIRVNDPVSATEVIQEHMSKVGKKPVEVLTEKARVFQSCQDYYNYELVVQELIAADPEGTPDYLRQLAMSHMERGARKEAREVLERLKREETDGVSDEFEAGVLALAGMREEALQSYRRGIARFPERIDTFLLLSNIQKELGRHTRSAGMFQHLAATAEKDDLFTIAIDGILNMRDGRGNRGAPDRLVRWARRIVLERVARRPNKLYLLRLVADLSDELRDTSMAIRALKTAVPVAGEQRLSILRELMTMAKTLSMPARMRNMSPLMRIRMAGGRQARQTAPNADLLMFGRRILAQGELVPPDTYLELGSAFLNAGEVANATKTFNQASQLPEFSDLRREFGKAFEQAGYPKEALRIYEQILSVENGDPGLITKVGELLEQTGRDAVALGLYQRGLDLLLGRSVFAKTGAKKEDAVVAPANPYIYMPSNRNIDDWQRHQSWMVQGLLATLTDATATIFLDEQRKNIASELDRMRTERKSGQIAADVQLVHMPRLDRRVTLFRRIAATFGHITTIDELDTELLKTFDKDGALLESAVRLRLSWSYVASARKLIEASTRPDAERKKLRLLAGVTDENTATGILTAPEAAGLLLPILIEGKRDAAKSVLERMNLSTDDKAALEHMPLLVGAAVFLRDQDLTLALSRHWLNVAVKQSPGMMYQTVESILRQGRKTLDKSQLRSLTEHVLAQVIENPDRFSVFLRRLPQLRDEAGTDFLTREQIEKLIKSRLDSSDRFIYGIEDLFALLHKDDRSNVLRSVWGRVPKSQRAYFLLRLVSVLDNEFDNGFSEFLGSAFERAITEADDTRILGYQVEVLADNAKVNLKLRLRFIESMVKSGESGLRMQGSLAILYLRLGRKDEAVAAIKQIFQAMFAESGPPRDPMANQAFYRLTRGLGKDHSDTMIAVMDEIEKQRKPSVELTRHRLNLLSRLGLQRERETALIAAAAKHPEDSSLRSQYISLLRSRGETATALALQAEALAKNESDLGLRRQLVSGYRGMRHPVKALELRKAGEKFEIKPAKTTSAKATRVAAPAVKKARTAAPSIAAVKKAFVAGDEPVALAVFRRLWRSYSPVVADPYGRSLRFMGRANRILWPKDRTPAKKPKTPAKPVKRSRGGLPEIFTRPLTPAELQRSRYRSRIRFYPGQQRTNPGDKPPISAHSVLAKTDAGRREVMRQLRSMQPSELGSILARDIYAALVDARVASEGREKVVDELLARDRDGHSSKIDYGMLAVLLDDGSDSSPAKLKESLSGLTGNLNPRDENQVRRLARLHARNGDTAKAGALYRWCALLAGTSRLPIYRYQGSDDLLSEVMKNLSGEARIEAIADILAAQDPGEFNRDMYLANVLQTWLELLPPAPALERSRRTLAEALTSSMMPNRNTCKLATIIHARAGEIDQALRCLEIALCKLEPPSNLKYPHYATYYEQFGYMSQYEVLKLFPTDMSDYKDAATWLSRATAKVIEWRAAKRLNESVPLQLLSALALRLHDHGETDVARKAIAELRDVASSSAGNLLWVADVARLTGDTDTAFAIERELFDHGRLHVERIPGVVGHIIAKEGPAAGLTLGEKAASATLHPKLLDQLVAAAKALEKADRVTHWENVRTEVAAAEKTLKDVDRKRAEDAKRRREEAAKKAAAAEKR